MAERERDAGDRIIESLREALTHARGEATEVRVTIIHPLRLLRSHKVVVLDLWRKMKSRG